MTPDPYAVADFIVPAGSTGSTGLAGSEGGVLDEVARHLRRYIKFNDDSDADVVALWAAHTWVCEETYTTPRLQLDSSAPGSGKTTVLEHLMRLAKAPLQAASLTSPALLARLLEHGIRTILIDEADRSLNPQKQGVEELIAIINSGYKRGATRPVLVAGQGGVWDAKEMPTFAPVVIAGNNPSLPEDTRSRIIRVLLMPDLHGDIEESDWELIEPDTLDLGERLSLWAESIRDDLRTCRPALPESVKGRHKERWLPLRRVAEFAGGRWPSLVDVLAEYDVQRIAHEREDGIQAEHPHLVLLKHLHEIWEADPSPFIATEVILTRLITRHPEQWSSANSYGKDLNAQRMGRMLSKRFNIQSSRLPDKSARGYTRASLASAFRAFGLDPRPETGQTGRTGRTGRTGPGAAT